MTSLKMGTVCALLGALPALAVEDRTIVNTIHDTPSDPDSDPVFEAEFELTASSVDADKNGPGGTVEWQVARATLTEIVQGSPDRTWTETLPDVDTQNGLWTIYHPDLNDIAASAFTDPPKISGQAVASGHSGNDLDYEFESSGGSGTPPYAVTGWAIWLFWELQAPSPVEEATNAPVEIHQEEDLS